VYCDRPVGLCVCLSVREHISGTARPISTKVCAQIPCGRGSVVYWRRCAMLCMSGFMDDVTCGGNWRTAGKGVRRAALSDGDQLRERPGRSLMSMNACILLQLYAE